MCDIGKSAERAERGEYMPSSFRSIQPPASTLSMGSPRNGDRGTGRSQTRPLPPRLKNRPPNPQLPVITRSVAIGA